MIDDGSAFKSREGVGRADYIIPSSMEHRDETEARTAAIRERFLKTRIVAPPPPKVVGHPAMPGSKKQRPQREACRSTSDSAP